jgi:hypothetical protein
VTVLTWMSRIYRLMLRAYPPEFRESYADEMVRTFRDRGREIAHAKGPWGLLRYAVFTSKDWCESVLRERMDSMQMPSLSTVRWIFLFFVALDLLLLKGLASPAARNVPVPFVLLVMYGLLVLWATANLDDSRRITLRTGTSLGLVSGIILTAWTTIGEYLWTPDGIAAVLIASTSMVMIFACWSVAGYRAARRTATMSSAWLAGCWSGVVCALVKVTCALLLLKTPLLGQSVGMVLAAAGQHLLEGPVIGALFGAIAGRANLRRNSPATVGLAGGK